MFEEIKEAIGICNDACVATDGVYAENAKKAIKVLINLAQSVLALDGKLPAEKAVDRMYDGVGWSEEAKAKHFEHNGYNLARKEFILAMAGKMEGIEEVIMSFIKPLYKEAKEILKQDLSESESMQTHNIATAIHNHFLGEK